jgi:hypothetical protein
MISDVVLEYLSTDNICADAVMGNAQECSLLPASIEYTLIASGTSV